MQPDPILTECLDLLRTCRDLLAARNRDSAVEALFPKSSAKDVIAIVSESSGVSVAKLLGRNRTGPVCTARDAAVWLMREQLGMPLAAIGAALGGRDHGTALNSHRNAKNRIETEAAFATWINELKRTITTTFPPSEPIGNEPKQSCCVLGNGSERRELI